MEAAAGCLSSSTLVPADSLTTSLAILRLSFPADIVALKTVLSVQQRKGPLSPSAAGKVE